MERPDIIEHLRTSLAAVLNRPLTDISEQSRLFEDLGLDSTSVIELLMALEDSMELRLDPDDLSPEVFHTVGTLADFVEAGLVRDRVA